MLEDDFWTMLMMIFKDDDVDDDVYLIGAS